MHMVNAVASEEGQGFAQKPLGRLLALIGHYGCVAEPGGIVHGHVDILPAGTGGGLLTVFGHPMAWALKAPKLLDVQVH